MRTVLYPGSFDPITTGHMDVIARAAAMFEQVIIGVLHNPAKPSGAFPPAERLRLIEQATAPLSNVRAALFDGLLIDAARACRADAVIRGLRTMGDAESELQMARLNRQIGDIETIFLAAAPGVMHISSDMVRQIGRGGGSLGGLVPESIRPYIENFWKHKP